MTSNPFHYTLIPNLVDFLLEVDLSFSHGFFQECICSSIQGCRYCPNVSELLLHDLNPPCHCLYCHYSGCFGTRCNVQLWAFLLVSVVVEMLWFFQSSLLSNKDRQMRNAMRKNKIMVRRENVYYYTKNTQFCAKMQQWIFSMPL